MPPIPESDSHPSRRNVLVGAAALLAAIPVARTYGQDATPAPADEQLLFVQVAESGTAEPIAGQSGQFDLTLANGSGQTLYFSDRPEQLAGVAATSIFLEALVSLAGDPPNAALVFQTEDDESPIRIAAVELTEPDASGGSIRYRARIIDATTPGALTSDDPALAVDTLPATFGQTTLFIDGAPDLGGFILPNGTSTHFPVHPD